RYLRVLEEHCGTALLRRDTHRMNLTQTGQRLLEDARTMLAHAEAADQRLREDQTMLSGHLRLFATMDLGQSIVTRLVSSFFQTNSKVTRGAQPYQPSVAHDSGGLRRRNPARQNHGRNRDRPA